MEPEVSDRLIELLADVKHLAQEYYKLTRKPLGVTAEIAEYEAARLLELELAPARTPGYDAIRKGPKGPELVQIKGRCLLPTSKRGQKLGRIDLEKSWDVVLLVLLNENFDSMSIFEADRASVTTALTAPGSKARNERGQLSIAKFRSVGSQLWPPIEAE